MADPQKPTATNVGFVAQPNDILLLYSTFPDQKTAEAICTDLIRHRLVACANILSPIRSIYWWKEQVENSTEVPALLKTKVVLFSQVQDRLKALHPYEVPCLIELPLGRVSPGYAQWLRAELCGPQ